MSGPYGPNGPGEGSNDPTQHWGGQQGAGNAGPTQHWGGAAQPPQQPPQGAQPTQHWGDPNAQQPPQQWGQPQQPGQQPPQWGQSQPQHPQPTGPQQWGQTQPPPQDWNAQAGNPQQQWGQQAQQPQQQWGQQPQQPWGQPPVGPQPSSGGKSMGLIIGLVVAGVLVLVAIVSLLFVLLSSDELDQTAVQDGVAQVLKDSYGIADVSDVSCPSGQAVEVDSTFTCDLKVSGEDKQVTVKVTKDDGTYEVGRPN